VVFFEGASGWEGGEFCEGEGESAPVWDVGRNILDVGWCGFSACVLLFCFILISNERTNEWANDRQRSRSSHSIAIIPLK
jgi:hypothetical protein